MEYKKITVVAIYEAIVPVDMDNLLIEHSVNERLDNDFSDFRVNTIKGYPDENEAEPYFTLNKVICGEKLEYSISHK